MVEIDIPIYCANCGRGICHLASERNGGIEVNMCEYCKNHQIRVSDDVYRYLKDMIEGEHIENGDMSGELNDRGEYAAYRPTFSEVISHLIEDREAMQ